MHPRNTAIKDLYNMAINLNGVAETMISITTQIQNIPYY